ncbi:hypothetical protein FisN_13Lh175 [Fistulifera solaris]|uniref:Uncharacterized protein n=1 Tax=Fistulifera solaris TaxID=1519565 RepID=A0A1Z5KLR7_FISSO|nr:hypothetical protein FisN_13Lh175 [Fistulifera solaris]|eukprot:GAX27264.1 hypothetical protein FisN_13Lh175 [Fistulifera solaris]
MTNPLTFEQLRDVRDQLRQPLSGRSVLVPLGPKAFVPGFLQPDGEEEIVTFVPAKSSGVTDAITISRTEALDRLQDEMDQISNRKKAPPSKGTRPTSHRNNILPYFEIREEIDSSGNELKAEAVNVSQHLEYLRQHPEVVQEETLPPAVTTASSSAGESVEEIPVSSLKPLSDGEYDALAARLEELARLEEDESRPPASKVMKKSNQKSGWNKGFLNTTSKTKKKPVVAPADKSDGGGRNDLSETLIQSTDTNKDKRIAPVPAKPISKSVFSGVIQEHGTRDKVEESQNKVATTPRVRFGDNANEIREIPRIGQSSVASLARNSSRPIVGAGNNKPQSKGLSRFAIERQQLNYQQ